MDKLQRKRQKVATKRGQLPPPDVVVLRQQFANVFLWRRTATGDVESLAGWRNADGWLPAVHVLAAADVPKELPPSKPLDLASEWELQQDAAAGDPKAILMLLELVKWYSRKEREAEVARITGGKERGKQVVGKAAETDADIAAFPKLTSGQVEQQLARKGKTIPARTVRRHRQKKPG